MKNKTTAALLSLILGGLGIHKFYLNKPVQGIIYLLLCWTPIPYIISVIEFIVLITMSNDKFNSKYNSNSAITTEKKHCISCGTELTFMSSPNFGGGFLSDGERVCRSCFAEIVKVDAGFGLNSKKKYNSSSIQKLLNTGQQNQVTTNDVFSTSVKSTGSNRTEMTIELNEENLIELMKQKQAEREHEIQTFNYQPAIIQGQAIQLLESVNILHTTKNIDTLKGRYEFINNIYDDFIKASYNRRYISDIQKSIDEYKRMYYDRLLNDFELQLIVKPDFENLKLYYSKCIYGTFIKYTNEQQQQIEQLKRESAKEKRNEKIAEVGNDAIFELDKLETDDAEHTKRIENIKTYIENLPLKKQNKPITSNIQLSDFKGGVIINPKSNFELTLYNSPQSIINEIIKILHNDELWNKESKLLPIFAEYNTKCKEIEEYIQQYKTVFHSKIDELAANSEEYQNASEMDKSDIKEEFTEEALESIHERAHCDLSVLFSGNDIDITIDDDLIKDYSFGTISKYFGFSQDKIYTDWERKDFEDLVKADLAEDAKNIPIEDILKTQPLKILNKICEKEEGHFKRKNKAIDYLNENPELKNNIGNHIATRKIFKIKSLPDKYNAIDYEEITNQWNYLKEYIRVLVDTYRASERYTTEIKEDNSWIKEFRIDIFEDLNSNHVCQCAREHKKKKYPKSNPPKLPFHIGCNCDLRKEI